MPQWLHEMKDQAWRIGLVLAVAVIAIGTGVEMDAGFAAVPLNREDELQLGPTVLDSATEELSTPTASPTNSPTTTPSPTASLALNESEAGFGTLLYVSRSDGYDHIVAFSPARQQARFLAAGPWHDRDPVASPDGQRIAFSSHRDGNWDLYLMDVIQGSLRRLTNTQGYEGNPTWSPDGMWIAYEAYYGSSFDIWIMAVDASLPPIQLTTGPAADTSPDWDPVRRRIAFVSDRDGEPDIYVAHLDRADNRFVNLTADSSACEMDPAFSPDGSLLAYVSRRLDLDYIMVKDASHPELPGFLLGQGRSPAWTSDGLTLLAILSTAANNHLMVYPLDGNGSSVAGLPQPERLGGIGWSSREVISDLLSAGVALETSTLNSPAQDPVASGSVPLEPLTGVSAPIPMLSQSVASAFLELKNRLMLETGWDFLGTLDYAFVGVNDPMPPGFPFVDWLYTGRAFSISTGALHARWVEILREDFGGLTYWRVFVRASRQDGSLGEPLRRVPWDLEARFGGDPSNYDGGGAYRPEIPEGYYIDFTELAADYGFERQPALPNWRTFFPGARFGEYVRMDGRTWHEAMLEIYPPSAFATPTPYRTPVPGG